MGRPCFLVIDREFPGCISTRKLVIETFKFNVITAYSGTEALETLQRFPAVSGIVLDAGMRDIACTDLVRDIKELVPKVPIIVISAPGFVERPESEYLLESFDPARLLDILRKLEPDGAAEIETRNEALSKER